MPDEYLWCVCGPSRISHDADGRCFYADEDNCEQFQLAYVED